jgi:hypothetical protein
MAGLAPPLKGLSNLSVRKAGLFIRQSSRSNYCGVYSTAMLLSLLGRPTTRSRALALFKLHQNNPDYTGAAHSDMKRVVAAETPAGSWRWNSYRGFNLVSISRSLRTDFRKTLLPALLSFGIIHKNGKFRCGHVVVATRTSGNVIEVLDPLASAPKSLGRANVWLQKADASSRVRVIGNSYKVDHESDAAILRWSPEK